MQILSLAYLHKIIHVILAHRQLRCCVSLHALYAKSKGHPRTTKGARAYVRGCRQWSHYTRRDDKSHGPIALYTGSHSRHSHGGHGAHATTTVVVRLTVGRSVGRSRRREDIIILWRDIIKRTENIGNKFGNNSSGAMIIIRYNNYVYLYRFTVESERCVSRVRFYDNDDENVNNTSDGTRLRVSLSLLCAIVPMWKYYSLRRARVLSSGGPRDDCRWCWCVLPKREHGSGGAASSVRGTTVGQASVALEGPGVHLARIRGPTFRARRKIRRRTRNGHAGTRREKIK